MKQMIKILLFFLFPILILSCGQISGKDQGDATQTKYGNVSAQIIWPEEGAKRKTGDNLTALQAAMPSTIVTIRMTVAGGGMTSVSKDFNASDGRGVLPGVAIGDRILTCQGKNSSGKVLYSGSSPAAVVEDGNVNVTVEMKYVGNDSLLKGLVAYYPFNGNANDESGNGNDGIVRGATLTEDRFGNANSAHKFNGVDSYISCGSSSSLNVNFHSIFAWVKLQSDNTKGYIIGKVNPSVHEAMSFAISENRISVGFATGTQANQVHPSPTVLDKNVWYQVGMTYDGTNIKIFLNGNLDTTSARNGTVRTNSNFMAIGRHGGDARGDDLFFSGDIDDVRIYNRALSETEIQNLYTPGVKE